MYGSIYQSSSTSSSVNSSNTASQDWMNQIPGFSSAVGSASYSSIPPRPVRPPPVLSWSRNVSTGLSSSQQSRRGSGKDHDRGGRGGRGGYRDSGRGRNDFKPY